MADFDEAVFNICRHTAGQRIGEGLFFIKLQDELREQLRRLSPEAAKAQIEDSIKRLIAEERLIREVFVRFTTPPICETLNDTCDGDRTNTNY